MNLKLKFALLVIFLLVLPIHALNCCDPSGECSCTATGTCSYTCNANYYNCDGNADNGCESATPCNHYTFQRFTFDLSDYDTSRIEQITYCFEGYYTTNSTGSAKLQYYNVTSNSWVDDQSISSGSESVKCKTISRISDVVNDTKIFQFAARGFTDETSQVVIYTDNVNLTISYSSTSNNEILWGDGKFGYGVVLNGSNYIDVPDSSSLDITGQLTAEAWINTTTVAPAYQTILQKGDSSNENYGLYLKGDELYFEWINSGIRSVETTSADLQANTWYHVAAVFNYSGSSVKLYVNGAQKASSSPPADLLMNTGGLKIGSNRSDISNFTGTIDEVAIYSRAKSPGEIYADANPVYISLDVRDALNNSVTVRGASAGYINPGGNNTFHLKMNNNGMLNMTAGAYAGLYSLRTYVNNTKVSLLIKTVQEGVSSIQAVLPVQLRLYQQTFSNLIIAEK